MMDIVQKSAHGGVCGRSDKRRSRHTHEAPLLFADVPIVLINAPENPDHPPLAPSINTLILRQMQVLHKNDNILVRQRFVWIASFSL